MTDCEWPDDILIDELVDRMTAEYRELFITEYLFGNEPDDADFDIYINQMRTKFAVAAYAFVTLSPPEIWDSYHGVAAAGGETFAGELGRTVDAIDDSISDWEGPAAEAFSRHVEDMRTFADFQAKYVDQTLQHLAAAYKLAIQAREDYHHLVDGWIEVSRAYRESKEAQDLGVSLKLGAGVIASVVAVVTAPEVVAAGLGGGAAGIGAFVEGVTGSLGGTDAMDIINSYLHNYDRLKQFYDAELDELRRFVEGRRDDIAQQQVYLYEPLPVVCDVDGPDFRYENFFHDFTPPGDFGGKVSTERKKYVAEKNQGGSSSISRALSGVGVGND